MEWMEYDIECENTFAKLFRNERSTTMAIIVHFIRNILRQYSKYNFRKYTF